MTLYFNNAHGAMREIARFDDYRTDREILTAAFAEIDAFCKERNFKTYYTRVWNEERDSKIMTKFDVGSHTEFFYLYPSVDIDGIRDSEAKPANILTSYFAKLNKLTDEVVPISICGKAPDWYTGIQYKKLAPSWSIYSEYKAGGTIEQYTVRFKTEILDKLDPKAVYDDLLKLADGKQIALICYEKSTDFCHRHIVANWLSEALGIPIKEYVS